MRVLVAGFQSGEFSPLLEGNSAIAQAANGCRLLRNMIPRSLGGAFQRPGFLFAGLQRDQTRKTRLIPFTFSNAVTYRIELGHNFARFWIGNRLVIHQPGLTGPMYASTAGQVLVLNTPWTSDEVFQVQFAQANDVTWLTHDNHWPRRLIRFDVEDWRIEEMPVMVPPLRDPNTNDAITISSSALAGATTLTAAGGNVFEVGDVGGYYEIAHRRALPFADLGILNTGTSSAIRVNGKWEVYTYGTWNGTLYLEKQLTTGAWEVLRTWKSASDLNVQSNGEVEGDAQLRLRFVEITPPASGAPRAVLSATDSVVHGLVKITGYTSPTVVTGTVTRAIFATTATNIWAEGSWSTRRGFPRAVTLHGQRIVFAGNRSQGQTIWGSSVNGFDNFERTTLEDAGFTYQIAATQSNAIVWIASQKGLLIGTEGDEWAMDGGADGQSITASSVRAERRSGYGSQNIQAQLIGSAIIFIQGGGTVMNEYLFAFQQQDYEAIDLTELADHLGDEKIIQFAYAQNPHSIIWAVTDAGSLLSLTYKRKNQTLAWAKHRTPNGVFESVCCTPGAAGIHEVWVSVSRTFGATGIRTIERADTQYWPKIKAGLPRQLCVGDFAVMREMSATASITGLPYASGTVVQVLADGAIHPDCTVSGGAITLNAEATAVVVGLAPLVELQPMPVEIQMQDGSSFGRKLRIPEFSLKLWQSGGSPTYADTPTGKSFDIPFRSALNPTGQPVPLFTGPYRSANPARHNDTTELILRNETMLPLNVLSMVMQLEVHGD